MHSSIPAPTANERDENAGSPRSIFHDPAGVRWTRLRLFALAAGVALLLLGAAFAQSLLPGRAIDPIATRRVDVGVAAARAAAQAYIPSVSQMPNAVSPRHVDSGAWSPAMQPIAHRFAWVDPGDDEAMRALARHGSELTDVVLDGESLVGVDVELQGDVPSRAIESAHASGVRVLLAVDVTGDAASTPSDLTAAAVSPERRAALAATLAHKVAALHADGLLLQIPDDNMDDADSDARVALLHDVRAAMSPEQTLALAVDADFEPRTLRRQAEGVSLVLLHAHRDGSDSLPPGPPAPLHWLDLVLGAAADAVGPGKLVPMLPVRSIASPISGVEATPLAGSRSATWAETITKAAAVSIPPRWVESLGSSVVVLPGRDGLLAASGLVLSTGDASDAAAWLVWLADGASFADGLALSRSRYIPNVGLDELGGEDPRIWQVLAAASAGPEAVRRALSKLPPPETWQVVGDGVEMRVRSEVRTGRGSVSLTEDGLIASEHFEQLPAQVTVERRAPVPRGRVALTFDDGPDPEFTPSVLDLLAKYGVKATFFLIGTRVERDPEIVQRIVAEGHEIGNHSFSHPDFGIIAARNANVEIRATNLLLASITGRSALLFRPPFRADDAPQTQEDLAGIEAAMRNDMTVVASTIDPRDWERPGAATIVERVLTQTSEDGSGVVLLHDGGGNRSQTVEALGSILPGLQQRGFTFVQIHDLFGAADRDHTNPPVPTLLEARANQVVWWGGTWLIRALRAFALGSLILVAVRFGAMVCLSLLYGVIHRASSLRHTMGEADCEPVVSVIIPAYNEERVIARTVQSVLSSKDVALEVIVVDDGSTDDTGGVVTRTFGHDPRVKYLRVQNGGKARALNLGFSHAWNEIVVALDADTLFLPDTIARLVEPMRDPRVAAVAGRAVVGNVRGFFGRCQALEYVCGQAIERRAWAALGVVSVVPGAVGAWRRDAVLLVGGFARDTLAEDSDLTIDLQVTGWRIAYAPQAIALTEAPEGVRALIKQRFRWTFGVLQTLWKHKQAFLRPSTTRPTVRWLLLPTVLTCHFGVPLLAPLVDLAGLGAVYLGYGRELVPYAIACFLAELLLTVTAMLIDRAPARIAWDWLAQRAIYRWVLFFALVRAAIAALRGGAVGWNKLARTGTVRIARVTV